MTTLDKLAIYWTSGCGGCEIALVNLHEKLIELADSLTLVFCPCLLDTKKSDLEAMEDGSITITLINGAIRTGENEEMARLLRKKSELVIACGACSCDGGVVALGNFSTKTEMLKEIYLDSLSVDNPAKILPRENTIIAEGMLQLPELLTRVKKMDEVIKLDYFLPGCPPEPENIWKIINSVISKGQLPPKGSFVGVDDSTVCRQCKRQKQDKKITKFYRTYEIIPDQDRCLLEQGLICMGVATRAGCGALCPNVNMPCTGCYGGPENIQDQGASMVAALGSIIDMEKFKGLSEQEINEQVDYILDAIPDYGGTFYKFSLASAILKEIAS